MAINIENVLAGYIGCALWSTTDCRDEADNDTYSLDDEFSDVSGDCKIAMRSDCDDFVTAQRQNMEWFKARTGCDDWRVGMLFWLNRSGHGSGFWDEGNGGTPGELLSDASKPYGTFELFGDFEAGVVRSHHYG